MENNQQNRDRGDQGMQRGQNNENNMMEQQQNNESLNTASQQPVQNLREQVGEGRSYDYGAQNSPEQENEREAPRH